MLNPEFRMASMNTDGRRTGEDFLDPKVVRPRLLKASVYIAAFEVLKDCIVRRLRKSFSPRVNSEDVVSPEYNSEVLSRNSSRVYASLDWLASRGAIDSADLVTFERVKACRNLLAHELHDMLTLKELPVTFETCFKDMVDLLQKIECWWITDGREVDYKTILSGSVLGIQLLYQAALGSDELTRFYEEEFKQHIASDPF